MIATYTDRESFLAAVVAALDRAPGRRVIFGKYSPAPLPVASELVAALDRQVASGGALALVLRRADRSSAWIDELIARFAGCERVRIGVRGERDWFPPALVIDTSDVFLHVGWSERDRPLPYAGIHLAGPDEQPGEQPGEQPDKQVERLAHTLWQSLELSLGE